MQWNQNNSALQSLTPGASHAYLCLAYLYQAQGWACLFEMCVGVDVGVDVGVGVSLSLQVHK